MEENAKKIGWIEISRKKYGGVVYNEQARDFLSKYFQVELVDCSARVFKSLRPLKLLESFYYLFGLRGEKEIWIRDFYSTFFIPGKTKGKNIVMIHHLDFTGFTFFERLCLNFLKNLFFFSKLKRADIIVVVSQYWEDFFRGLGYSNIFKIYNGFELDKYNITEQEVGDFKRENQLLGKPIIYLGNCQKCKGVVESYNVLKDLDAYLVTSGEEEVKIPALNFNLDYREYLKLLKAADIVLTMSKFKEGWCRTAHEAMLLKTPVIGSGSGGMTELLEGGKQTICHNFKELKNLVQELLTNEEARKKMGQLGYNYVRNFSIENTKKNWVELITEII